MAIYIKKRKTEGRRRRGRQDEIVGWHHGHEFEQTPGDGERQRSLVCCSPWGLKESDTTEQLNNKVNIKNVSQEEAYLQRNLNHLMETHYQHLETL